MDAARSDPFRPRAEPVPFRPDPRSELPRGAEVVVVGAGFSGAFTAWHLARAGMHPLVLEANTPASGASGRLCGLALAGLGGHFERVNRLVRDAGGRSILDYTRRSLDFLESLETTIPGGVEWERCGSLDLLTTEAEEAHGRDIAAAEAADGLEVQVLDPAAASDLAPALDTGEIRAAKWTPGDGQVNPFKLVYGLLEAVTALGGQVVTGVRVEGIAARGGRVAGVETSHGPVSAGALVVATNAWTPWLVPAIGPNLTPIREHVLVTERLPRILHTGFETNLCNEYWRQEPTGEVIVGGFAAADEQMGIGSYSMAVRRRIPPRLAGLLGRFHPALRDARIVRSWAGLLDFAAEEIPMAGPMPAADGTPVPGGYLLCGLTGHGLPYTPILGQLLAELIVDGATPTLPLDPFDPARYARGPREPTWVGAFEGGLG